jgi:hypothetical protein
LRLALADPGAFVERRHDLGPEGDETEPLYEWQARAVTAYLREQADAAGPGIAYWTRRTADAIRKLADKIDERNA